jgi:hypothetical protein
LKQQRIPFASIYKGALRMAFAMASLKRPKSGAYIARKGISKDVRAEYERLVGQRWEASFHLEAGPTSAEAKAANGEWLAERKAASRRSARRRGARGVPLRTSKPTHSLVNGTCGSPAAMRRTLAHQHTGTISSRGCLMSYRSPSLTRCGHLLNATLSTSP